ncbi:50S ribosomal protein L15 [Nafulsella turpanensis]|uniref:50S ribosomal protein L15 n=1 Tax=Nafulsella turpanensis TaxID=1265690 RepID=UPI00034D84CE|nr:50S ribosomal protein L15 [Nafulsella turpanensis]
MKLNNLKPAANSTKSDKRIGRGQGSGKGGTSTRGHKGAKSRSGYSKKIGFEGGQMPLQRRVPKFGFKNPGRVAYKAINLYVLEDLANQYNLSKITIEELEKHGLADKNDKVKILGQGQITKALEVEAHSLSSSAQEAIEKAGGKAVKL